MVPRVRGGTVRIKKRLALVAAIAMLAVAVGAVAANADVDRYQGVDYELTVTEVNGNTDYSHLFHIFRDPYLDWYTGSGWSVFHDDSESLSAFEGDDDSLSFRADYDFDDYYWFPSFTLKDDGTLTFADGYGDEDDNVTEAEGTWTATDTEYKNHGQYVKQAEDKKEAAHSLIGMPTQSKKKNK